MKHILYLFILGALAVGITSCDSENPASGSTTKELEVTPSKTSVGIYESFTIKARMTNTPLSDVKLQYDYGNGAKEEGVPAGFVRYFFYDKIGTYTINVIAMDAYSGDTLAIKHITMNVSDVIPSVTFERDIIDTTLMSNSEGKLGNIRLMLSTNTIVSKIRYHFGDGRTDSITHNYPFSIDYEAPGTYNVIVDIYNDKGNYWASDTMTVTIRLPEVTLDMLTSAYNVSVALAVDTTSPIYSTVREYGHIEAGIQNGGDSIKRITWNGHSFDAYVGGNTLNCHFIGTLSSDLKKLESMTVAGFDSVHTYDPATRWGYRLTNVELAGMNDKVVIFRAAYRPLAGFVSNEFIQGKSLSFLRSFGNVSTMLNNCVSYGKPLPYAYVVFTRK